MSKNAIRVICEIFKNQDTMTRLRYITKMYSYI